MIDQFKDIKEKTDSLHGEYLAILKRIKEGYKPEQITWYTFTQQEKDCILSRYKNTPVINCKIEVSPEKQNLGFDYSIGNQLFVDVKYRQNKKYQDFYLEVNCFNNTYFPKSNWVNCYEFVLTGGKIERVDNITILMEALNRKKNEYYQAKDKAFVVPFKDLHDLLSIGQYIFMRKNPMFFRRLGVPLSSVKQLGVKTNINAVGKRYATKGIHSMQYSLDKTIYGLGNHACIQ